MRIAIYHSDPSVTQTFERFLRIAGHRVFPTTSRNELGELLAGSTFDLVVSEWHGTASSKAVSGRWVVQGARDTAIIFTTYENLIPFILENSGDRAVAFLQLPASAAQLIGEVDNIIERTYPWHAATQIRAGFYTLDVVHRTITLGNESLFIVNDAAFRLAYCFLVNANRPLSRDYLKEFVGGSVDGDTIRYIDNLVSKVRHLLLGPKKNGARIRSVYGFGYRIELQSELKS